MTSSFCVIYKNDDGNFLLRTEGPKLTTEIYKDFSDVLYELNVQFLKGTFDK